MMEENLRRALLLSRGDWTTFVTRPLSAGLLIAAALMIVIVMLPSIKQEARGRLRRRAVDAARSARLACEHRPPPGGLFFAMHRALHLPGYRA